MKSAVETKELLTHILKLSIDDDDFTKDRSGKRS